MRRAWPYRELARRDFDEVVRLLSEGFSTRRGRQNAYLYRDAVNHRLAGRRGARLTALTSGGAIPDNADYTVVLEPQGHTIGTLNEDFAVESLAGDIFQLGNTSYRILRVEASRVRVEDAAGQPPTMPFWLGEAPARSDELSFAISRLTEEIGQRLGGQGGESAVQWLIDEVHIARAAAEQLVEYLQSARAALGVLPTLQTVVMERFFDEAGGMQLVIHSPYGNRINRAWGLSLRKRFCRKFNFELQAAATEDAIVLSLGTSHSFPLEEVAHYLHSNSAREVLIQALLDAPMFATRWRWNASIALALPRMRGGNKVPMPVQRMVAEDLLASVFPDQLACAENLAGEREIPDDPLVRQTIADCLHVAMDIDGLQLLLRRIELGEVSIVARDLTEPSPLALEILTARPYAYLDDAPLEERRTQAVMSRRWLDPESAADIGRLDMEAIARVREEAWPDAESANELHDALLWLGFLGADEVAAHESWSALLEGLTTQRRAARLALTPGRSVWVAAERLPQFFALFPAATPLPPIEAPAEFARVTWVRDQALVEIVRGRLEGLGPVSAGAIAKSLALPLTDIDAALLKLETEGFVMRGSFTAAAPDIEWCERRLLARIHRYTVKRLRQEIAPVAARDYMRFLCAWQHVAPDARMRGPDAVATVIGELEGFEVAASAWETEILPARIEEYEPAWLDDLCVAGRAVWTRLSVPRAEGDKEPAAAPVRATPIALLTRRNAALFNALARPADAAKLRSGARAIADYLAQHGASFFDEIVEGTGLLRTQTEEALAELVALGIINSDSFSGLRALLLPADRRKPIGPAKRRRRTALFGIEDAGRWSLTRRSREPAQSAAPAPELAEHAARMLLKRYGVVFWRVLEREAQWLPPWRELLRVYRRLEARGEIRGGRFVSGFSGEQFAVPGAIGALRDARRKPPGEALVVVSGVDPLNLAGIITPGPKVPALASNRVVWRDGIPLATLVAGEINFLEELDLKARRELEGVLTRRASLSPMLAFMR
jgi:ATP-dependent Lhr-like helicase